MSRCEAISLTVESCFISKLLLKIISAYWLSTNETLWSFHHKELFSQQDNGFQTSYGVAPFFVFIELR